MNKRTNPFNALLVAVSLALMAVMFTSTAMAQAPTVTTNSPLDIATGVAVPSNLVLTFSESVVKGTGCLTIAPAYPGA